MAAPRIEKKVIPRFIQKNKEKIHMLDNLNHRRTTTIEQSQMSMILTRNNLSKSKSNKIVTQQRSAQKSLGKLKSVRTTSNTNKFNNLSFGSICKGMNPEFIDKQKNVHERLSYSGYSNKNIKKKEFPTDLRFIKSCKNVESILSQNSKYDECPNSPKTLKTSNNPHTPPPPSRLRR